MQVHVSVKHKALGVPVSAEVLNLFPGAKQMTIGGLPHAVMPHGMHETWLLRKFGYEVPAPIASQYDWAGGKPFDVQKRTCSMLTLNQRAYVLNDMGTGKTKSALWAWHYLFTNGFCKKMLVVAPLSTLNFTWAREVFNTLPGVNVGVLHGSRDKRLERLRDPSNSIFVINHDGVKVIQAELEKMIAAGEIDVLCIDELAVYRNGGSERTKGMRKLAARFQWVWGMTGSPIPHEPTDVWAQATIITPGTVPRYFGRFRDSLMTKLETNGGFNIYRPKPDAVERAFEVLQPAVRFTLNDVVELPECVERWQDVDLGPKQANVYKQLADHAYSAVASHEITATNAGAVLNKLLQVSTGWVYAKNGQTVPLDNLKRIEALVDAINGANNKVLVFAPFKHALDGISAALDGEKIEHEVVSGDTPAGRRNEIFNLFQNTGKYKCLVAHPQCLAHGITLTRADTIIWFAPVTSLEIYEQANRRIRRIGQNNKQLLLHLQSTAVERKIYAMLRTKQKIQESLLELFEEASLQLAA